MKTKYLFVILAALVSLLFVLIILTFYSSLNSQDMQAETYVSEDVVESVDISEEELKYINSMDGDASSIQAEDIGGNEVTVAIYKGNFYPSETVISPGTKVTWTNNDTFPHKIVAYDRVFYGDRMEPGDTYSFVFKNKGAHKYFDAIFPKSGRGTITIQEEPLPITGRVIGVGLVDEEGNAKFALLVVLFVIMVLGLSHGIYTHHKI